MFKLLNKKQGGSTLLEILLCITILTFFLFFPIICFSYFKFQSTVDDIAMTTLRVAVVRGGVDEEVMDSLVKNFEENGYSFDGSNLNGENSAKVIVRTNTNLCGGDYTFTTENGNSYTIEIKEWSSETTLNPINNSTHRRYRTGNSIYKEGGITKKETNGPEIKLELDVPISNHSQMLNSLNKLIHSTEKIEDTQGYKVILSGLSELYQESQIEHE